MRHGCENSKKSEICFPVETNNGYIVINSVSVSATVFSAVVPILNVLSKQDFEDLAFGVIENRGLWVFKDLYVTAEFRMVQEQKISSQQH